MDFRRHATEAINVFFRKHLVIPPRPRLSLEIRPQLDHDVGMNVGSELGG